MLLFDDGAEGRDVATDDDGRPDSPMVFCPGLNFADDAPWAAAAPAVERFDDVAAPGAAPKGEEAMMLAWGDAGDCEAPRAAPGRAPRKARKKARREPPGDGSPPRSPRDAAPPAAAADEGRPSLAQRTRASVLARNLREEIATTLYAHCEKSFYSRTVTKIVLAGDVGADRCSTFAAEVVPLAAFALGLAFLQTWALQTAHQHLWYLKYGTMATEEGVPPAWLAGTFPYGVPGPVAYSAELDDSILTRGLPIFVIAPLVFTTFMLGMAVHKGVSGMKTAYLVIRWGARRERRRARFSKLGALRVALAFLLHGARFVMTTYFIQVTVMVVGTADGPFNLLLNSLAMFFILECDDVIDFDLPNGGYFGALRLDAWQAHITWKASLQGVLESLADAVVKTARTSRAAERLYTAFERLSNPLISAAMLLVTWHMQKHTTDGHITTPDDDWIEDAPEVTRYFDRVTFFLVALIVTDMHVAWSMASDAAGGGWLPRAADRAARLALFACELAVGYVVLVVGVHWAINILLCWNRSEKTSPLQLSSEFSDAVGADAHAWDDYYYAYDYGYGGYGNPEAAPPKKKKKKKKSGGGGGGGDAALAAYGYAADASADAT